MTELLEYGEKYIRTFFDFWRLRSRRFIQERKEDASRFMSPYQFLIISIAILSVLNFAANSGDNSDILAASMLPTNLSGYALATMSTVYAVSYFILASLFYFIIAKLWPIQRSVEFLEVFEFNCYMYAVKLPLYVFNLYLSPWLGQLLLRYETTTGPLWIVLLVLTVYSFFIWTIWLWPGIAQLLNMPTFWVVIGSILWFVLFIALGIAVLFGVVLLIQIT